MHAIVPCRTVVARTSLVTLRRALAFLTLATVLASAVIALAPVKQALAADNVWACSIPPGATWDQVLYGSNGCAANSLSYIYHLRTPADGLWVCSIPSDFTWDEVLYGFNGCAANSLSYKYHLRKPAHGLWVCSIPSGFTWDQVLYGFNGCAANSLSYKYHLV